MRILAGALVCGALLAACGKADDSSPGGTPPPSTTPPPTGTITPPPAVNPTPTPPMPPATTPTTMPMPPEPPPGGVPPAADAGAPATPAAPGTAPYGCTGCKRLFNGMNLDGWDTAPGAWVVKEGGVLASTGKAADIYTHEDLGNYRIFFQMRHLPAMGGKDHQACITMFGKRPASPTAPARALGGAQFQPPNGYSWDYGVGGKFASPAGKMKLDASKWNQCEIISKEAGSFRAACCTLADGAAPCKTQEVLTWTGPGRKHPFDFMMHNGGLFDEYREVWIEVDPKEDAYLSQK